MQDTKMTEPGKFAHRTLADWRNSITSLIIKTGDIGISEPEPVPVRSDRSRTGPVNIGNPSVVSFEKTPL